MKKVGIEFAVNGKKRSLSVKPNDLLINIIRNDLFLTGSKYSCSIGECGACTVLVEDFVTGVGKTVIEADELITQINLPEMKKNSGSAFSKKGRVKADIAKINLAVCLEREDNSCKDCKIVLGSVAVKAIRVKEAESLLKGQIVSTSLIDKIAKKASEEIKPIDDIRSSVEYRTEIARVMVEDTVRIAWERAGGEL